MVDLRETGSASATSSMPPAPELVRSGQVDSILSFRSGLALSSTGCRMKFRLSFGDLNKLGLH